MKINYSSAKAIIKNYKREGRIDKKSKKITKNDENIDRVINKNQNQKKEDNKMKENQILMINQQNMINFFQNFVSFPQEIFLQQAYLNFQLINAMINQVLYFLFLK